MIRSNSLAHAIAAVVMTAAAPSAAIAAPAHAAGSPALGAVYTATNDAAANSILVFDRLADGRLVPGNSVDTGGRGSASGLGNQGGVRLTPDERWLLAVNAGSDEVSVFGVGESSLTLTDIVSSGGSQPISVTANRDLVYVVNAGSDSIAGFRLDPRGHLASLAGSVRSLGGSGTGPAEIAFSPDGNFLVVTEKNTNKIAVFPVDQDGLAGAPLVQDAAGMTPFGFAFGKRGQLFVSEAFGGAADASATSSYTLGSDGILSTITASAADDREFRLLERNLAGRTIRLHRQHRQRHGFRLSHRLRRTYHAARCRRRHRHHRWQAERSGFHAERPVPVRPGGRHEQAGSFSRTA